MSKVNKVSDFVDTPYYDGQEVVNAKDVLGKKFVAKDVKYPTAKYGEFASLLVTFEGEEDEKVLLCGGEVVIDKTKKIKDNDGFPVEATITKEDRYYDIN